MAFLRKIPDIILAKIYTFNSPFVRVASVLSLNSERIDALGLDMIGIKLIDGKIQIPSGSVYPDISFGAVAKENVNGKELVDKKSPKISKQIYLGDRPIYGDWSNGSFDLWQTRKVYRRKLIQAKGFSLVFTAGDFDERKKSWIITASIEPVLDRKEKNFDESLIFALSLLHEIVGKVDVFPSDVTPDQMIDFQIVSWKIFPPGQRNFKIEVEKRIALKPKTEQGIILDRAATIINLKPLEYILGSGLASNYYGALFADDLVVFENLDYGNATYLLYENWRDLSKLSRTELLNGRENYDRLIHDKNWAKSLKEVVTHELRMRKRR